MRKGYVNTPSLNYFSHHYKIKQMKKAKLSIDKQSIAKLNNVQILPGEVQPTTFSRDTCLCIPPQTITN